MIDELHVRYGDFPNVVQQAQQLACDILIIR